MIEQLPKVVLHDHLDGGLRVDTVIDLAAEQGYDQLPATDPTALTEWFDQSDSRSLERYLAAFRHTVGVLRTPAALERVAYEAVIDLAADGVVYAELRFAPSLVAGPAMDRREAIEAVLSGLRAGEEETGMVARAIVDAMRNDDDSEKVAMIALEYHDAGVVAFDLAGPERGFPADAHLPACRAVREANFGLTIHAGEGDGPNSIWRALQRCGALRIGHGVRIAEDCQWDGETLVSAGRLASYVRDRRIPLEVCIVSNLHTTGWREEQHPVGRLYRAGFNVTLNTDNRLMSGTSMNREFAIAAQSHGFTVADLQQVTEAALAAAFIDHETRRYLLNERIRPVYAGLV